MTKTEYLYGEDVEVVPIPQEVIMRRLVALNDLLEELLSVELWSRDDVRCRAVMQERDKWEKLDEET